MNSLVSRGIVVCDAPRRVGQRSHGVGASLGSTRSGRVCARAKLEDQSLVNGKGAPKDGKFNYSLTA